MSQTIQMKYAQGSSADTLYLGLPPTMHSVILKSVRAVVSKVSSLASEATFTLQKSSTSIATVALGATSSASEGMIKNGSIITSSSAHLTEFTSTDVIKITPNKAIGSGVNVEFQIELDYYRPKD